MAVVGKFRAAKNARVKVGNTNLNMATWDTTLHGDDIDLVHFECGGADQGTVGIIGLDYNLGGNWDAGRNAYDSPPGLYPRDDLASLAFYENVADNVFFSVPIARVLSARNGAQVRQAVTFQASGKSNGTVVYPTGSV